MHFLSWRICRDRSWRKKLTEACYIYIYFILGMEGVYSLIKIRGSKKKRVMSLKNKKEEACDVVGEKLVAFIH